MSRGHRPRGSAMHTEEGANTLCSGSTQLFKKTLSPRTNHNRVPFVGGEQEGRQEPPPSDRAAHQRRGDRRSGEQGRALSQLGQRQPGESWHTEPPCPSWDSGQDAVPSPATSWPTERRAVADTQQGIHIRANARFSGLFARPWNTHRANINRINVLQTRGTSSVEQFVPRAPRHLQGHFHKWLIFKDNHAAAVRKPEAPGFRISRYFE